MTTKEKLRGYWHPHGYFGNCKRVSSDWNEYFRREAKPMPPERFIQRSQAIKQHTFSMHDNRHTFHREGSYFESTLGKKRPSTAKHQNKPTRNLLSWGEDRTEPDLLSTYRISYRNEKEAPLSNACSHFLKHRDSINSGKQTRTREDYTWNSSSDERSLNNHISSRPSTSYQPQKRILSKRPQSAMSFYRQDTSNLLKWDIEQVKPVITRKN